MSNLAKKVSTKSMHKEHPVFFVEIKASNHIRHMSTRKDADLQMRERFEELFDDVKVETLYGISALGTKLCIYTASKETGGYYQGKF
ncbi:hypothetical protein BGX38DRAFT_1270875 [Terfezia claveryi]|nr:hypothetical protein BGX38DRAFT_1270875 [Terfezia claveryi]